jgi:cytochrome c556
MSKTAHTLIRSIAISTLLAGAACGGGEPSTPAQPEYQPVATVRDIMRGVMDPDSAAIWESVATTVTQAGMEERVPKTDEEWGTLRLHALKLMEAGNLLQMPGRRIALPGEKSSYPGIELGPEEIQALVDKDLAGWRMRAAALHDAVMPSLQAIDAKDARKLEEVGEEIDTACENCHLQYWYPNAPEPPDKFPDTQIIGEPVAPAKE